MSWYNGSWTKRVKVTIDHTKVSATLSDFPVYIDLSDLPSGFHTNVNQTDARDIRVTKADGTTELPREIVFYDSSTDTGELHFKADSLSSSANTEFYIYYGNSSATEPAVDATYGAENVWDSNFKAVYHLQADPSGTAPQLLDSTSNSNDLTSGGSMTSGDSVAVKIGKGIDFDGTDDELLSANNIGITGAGNRTISAWVKQPIASNKNFLGFGSTTTGGCFDMLFHTNKVAVHCYGGGYDNISNAPSYTANTLVHAYAIYNGTSVNSFVNGTGGTATNMTLNTANSVLKIGKGTYSVLDRLTGQIDEVRVSDTVRSTDWMGAEYSNTNDTSGFYTAGTEESRPVSGWLSGWDYRVKITIDHTEVDSDLSNFPVYVDLSDLPSGFHTNVNQTDARDIRVTKADGTTELPREVVSYDSSTDTGELHFKADSLSSSANTDFYIYYGNGSASDYATNATYGAENVWADYNIVVHFDEDPTSSDLLDSTGNGNDGTPEATGLSRVAGKVGRATAHDSKIVDFGQTTDSQFGNGDFTVSLWAQKGESSSGWSNVAYIGKWNTGAQASTNEWIMGATVAGSDDKPTFSVVSGTTVDAVESATALTLDTWYYIVAKRSGGTLYLYVDGVEKATNTTLGTLSINTINDRELKTGSIEASTSYNLEGIIDELRIIKGTAFSVDWISAEYVNQSTPTTFYLVGTQEEPSASGTSADSERGLYIQGKSSTNSTRGLYITGSHTLSTDYFNVEFGLAEEADSERSLYLTGSLDSDSERSLCLTGSLDNNSERNLYLGVVNTSDSERTLYLGTIGYGSSEVAMYLSGVLGDSSERNLYLQGKATNNSERTLYAEVVNTGSSARNMYIPVDGGNYSDRFMYLSGKDTGSSERGLYVAGGYDNSSERSLYLGVVSTGTSERSLYAGVVDTDSSERSLYLIGSIDGSGERNLYLEGFVNEDSERGLYLTGSLPGDSERSLYLSVVNTGSSERSIYLGVVNGGTSERNPYLTGSLDDDSERSLYLSTKGASSSDRNLYLTGSTTDSSERSLHLGVVNTGDSQRGLYITGCLSDNSERTLYLSVNQIGSSERGMWLHGSMSGTPEMYFWDGRSWVEIKH